MKPPYMPPPIDIEGFAPESAVMDQDGDRLVQRAAELTSAAQRLAESTANPSSAAYLPIALSCVGETLDALSRAFEGAAHSLVPPGERFERNFSRFERAAEEWPETHGCEAPSHERQAQLLSSLYEAGANLRMSRRASERASAILADLTDPSASTAAAALQRTWRSEW